MYTGGTRSTPRIIPSSIRWRAFGCSLIMRLERVDVWCCVDISMPFTFIILKKTKYLQRETFQCFSVFFPPSKGNFNTIRQTFHETSINDNPSVVLLDTLVHQGLPPMRSTSPGRPSRYSTCRSAWSHKPSARTQSMSSSQPAVMLFKCWPFLFRISRS